jgi:hypothetical protein
MKRNILHPLLQLAAHLRRPLVYSLAIVILLIGGGLAVAATHPSVFTLIGISSSGSTSRPSVAASLKVGSPTASPTPTPTITSTVTPSPAAHGTGPVTIGGHVYGAPTDPREPGVSNAPSNKPLILSTTNITVAMGKYSELITAKSPDGLSICALSGGYQNVGLYAAYPNSIPCGMQQVFFLTPATRIGVFTVEVSVSTQDKVNNGKYISYSGYITVTVTGSPSFWLTPGNEQLTYDGANLLKVPSRLIRIPATPAAR